MATDTAIAACPLNGSRIHGSYESFGCRVNALTPEVLFSRYQDTGFLYPEKAARVASYLPLILDNWRKAFRGGELLLSVTTCDLPKTKDWATLSCWRSTNNGWISQHLASTSPHASRSVMLGSTAVHINDGLDRSFQDWFRPVNKYARRLFGSVVESLGEEHASVRTWKYVALPLHGHAFAGVAPAFVREATEREMPEIYDLATRVRGAVYAQAEELDLEDLNLEAVDVLYRRVGLRRYRRVFLASNVGSTLRAAAIVYRAPLGLNLSFLENRCDLLVCEDSDHAEISAAVSGLLPFLREAYADFHPQFIPITTDARTADILVGMRGNVLTEYTQSIWLHSGFQAWYMHLERAFERIHIRDRRRGES